MKIVFFFMLFSFLLKGFHAALFRQLELIHII